jgi:Replication initiator protein A
MSTCFLNATQVRDLFSMSHRGSDMASMAHPIFSLSTKPETRILKYQHDDTVVEIQLGA